MKNRNLFYVIKPCIFRVKDEIEALEAILMDDISIVYNEQ